MATGTLAKARMTRRELATSSLLASHDGYQHQKQSSWRNWQVSNNNKAAALLLLIGLIVVILSDCGVDGQGVIVNKRSPGAPMLVQNHQKDLQQPESNKPSSKNDSAERNKRQRHHHDEDYEDSSESNGHNREQPPKLQGGSRNRKGPRVNKMKKPAGRRNKNNKGSRIRTHAKPGVSRGSWRPNGPTNRQQHDDYTDDELPDQQQGPPGNKNQKNRSNKKTIRRKKPKKTFDHYSDEEDFSAAEEDFIDADEHPKRVLSSASNRRGSDKLSSIRGRYDGLVNGHRGPGHRAMTRRPKLLPPPASIKKPKPSSGRGKHLDDDYNNDEEYPSCDEDEDEVHSNEGDVDDRHQRKQKGGNPGGQPYYRIPSTCSPSEKTWHLIPKERQEEEGQGRDGRKEELLESVEELVGDIKKKLKQNNKGTSPHEPSRNVGGLLAEVASLGASLFKQPSSWKNKNRAPNLAHPSYINCYQPDFNRMRAPGIMMPSHHAESAGKKMHPRTTTGIIQKTDSSKAHLIPENNLMPVNSKATIKNKQQPITNRTAPIAPYSAKQTQQGKVEKQKQVVMRFHHPLLESLRQNTNKQTKAKKKKKRKKTKGRQADDEDEDEEILFSSSEEALKAGIRKVVSQLLFEGKPLTFMPRWPWTKETPRSGLPKLTRTLSAMTKVHSNSWTKMRYLNGHERENEVVRLGYLPAPRNSAHFGMKIKRTTTLDPRFATIPTDLATVATTSTTKHPEPYLGNPPFHPDDQWNLPRKGKALPDADNGANDITYRADTPDDSMTRIPSRFYTARGMPPSVARLRGAFDLLAPRPQKVMAPTSRYLDPKVPMRLVNHQQEPSDWKKKRSVDLSSTTQLLPVLTPAGPSAVAEAMRVHDEATSTGLRTSTHLPPAGRDSPGVFGLVQEELDKINAKTRGVGQPAGGVL